MKVGPPRTDRQCRNGVGQGVWWKKWLGQGWSQRRAGEWTVEGRSVIWTLFFLSWFIFLIMGTARPVFRAFSLLMFLVPSVPTSLTGEVMEQPNVYAQPIQLESTDTHQNWTMFSDLVFKMVPIPGYWDDYGMTMHISSLYAIMGKTLFYVGIPNVCIAAIWTFYFYCTNCYELVQ